MRDITRKAKPQLNLEFQERKDVFVNLLNYVQTNIIDIGDIISLTTIRDHYQS